MTTTLDVRDRNQPFIHFGNAHQLFVFMQDPENYTINFQQKTISVKWRICGHAYVRNIQTLKIFQASQLTQKQSLQLEIILLKRKIAEFERKNAARLRRRHIKTAEAANQDNQDSQLQNQQSVEVTNKKNIFDLEENQNISKNQKSEIKQDGRRYRTRNGDKNKPIQKRKYTRHSYSNSNINQQKKDPFRQKRKYIRHKRLEDRKKPQRHNNPNSRQYSEIKIRANKDHQAKQKNEKQKDTFIASKQSQNSKPVHSSYLQRLIASSKNQKQLIEAQIRDKDNQSRKSKFVQSSQSPMQKKNTKTPKNQRQILHFNVQHNSSSNQNSNQFANVNNSNYQSICEIGDKFRVTFKNGDYYFGEMKNGCYHGHGIYFSSTNGTYEGQWVNGAGCGHGVSKDVNGNRYQGMHLNDVKHGKGTDFFATGQKYQGDFNKGEREGYGTYYFTNGDKYEGEWKNDLQDGKGKYTSANGLVYQGTWKQDQKEGQGIEYGPFGKVQQVWSKGQLIKHYIIKIQQPNQ